MPRPPLVRENRGKGGETGKNRGVWGGGNGGGGEETGEMGGSGWVGEAN